MRLACMCAYAIAAILSSSGFSQSGAQAPSKTCPDSDYSRGFDGCLHRNVDAVFKGCKERRTDCGQTPPASAPRIVGFADASKVSAQFACDLSAAQNATKGKQTDFGKAVIKGQFTFASVDKNTAGLNVSATISPSILGGIPIFLAGASFSPSIAVSSISQVNSKTTQGFSFPEGTKFGCESGAAPSKPNWLLADVFTNFPSDTVNKEITFVLTRQSTSGVNFNIVVVSFAPQVKSETDKTQQICLLFDWKPDPAHKVTCSSSGGSDDK
jgi:hypothetical protein